MQLDAFDYSLPDKCIAKYPIDNRTDSRLMILGAEGDITHARFNALTDYLKPGDLLILNNSRVLNARLFGQKLTGGKVEIMVERVLNAKAVMAQLKVSKSLAIGAEILIAEGVSFVVQKKVGSFWKLALNADMSVLALLEQYGHVPLPPYFKRDDESLDKGRYQTVYAKHHGSVAAPTAGLHFDQALLQRLHAKGVDQAYITLHVGAGTYQPIRAAIDTHQMHSEYCVVDQEVVAKIKRTKAAGGRVIAVGTTTIRALETAAKQGQIAPFCGETSIFLKPGSSFHCVDGLITNFHLPKSSLIVLVSAFSTVANIKKAYNEAIKHDYRFYSYGDAMLIFRR